MGILYVLTSGYTFRKVRNGSQVVDGEFPSDVVHSREYTK